MRAINKRINQRRRQGSQKFQLEEQLQEGDADGGQVVIADLATQPGINGGFSAPYRSRNPTLI